jgi:rhodanese-related sulfurtransferase
MRLERMDMTASACFPTRRGFMAGVSGFGLLLALSSPARADNSGDISDTQAYQRQQANQMVIVDIRTPPEWQETGVAKGALMFDMTAPDFIDNMVALRKANPDKEIGLMCRTSHRSSQAQTALTQAGFDRIYSIVGGLSGNDQASGWTADGLPVEK